MTTPPKQKTFKPRFRFSIQAMLIATLVFAMAFWLYQHMQPIVVVGKLTYSQSYDESKLVLAKLAKAPIDCVALNRHFNSPEFLTEIGRFRPDLKELLECWAPELHGFEFTKSVLSDRVEIMVKIRIPVYLVRKTKLTWTGFKHETQSQFDILWGHSPDAETKESRDFLRIINGRLDHAFHYAAF